MGKKGNTGLRRALWLDEMRKELNTGFLIARPQLCIYLFNYTTESLALIKHEWIKIPKITRDGCAKFKTCSLITMSGVSGLVIGGKKRGVRLFFLTSKFKYLSS